MRFTNLDYLSVFQNENNSRKLEFVISDTLSDCDIYIDFEKPDGTKSKVMVSDNVYVIPKALLDTEGFIKCQLVAYRGQWFIEKSKVYLFYVSGSINASEYIAENQPDVIEELQTEKADDLVYEDNVLQLMANGQRVGTPINIGGTEISVSEFQKALENISGHKIDHDCLSINEVLRGINSFYEFAKIIVNATDSVTGEVIPDIVVTVISASDYKSDDGYYYIPASDTIWTVRVTETNHNMKSTTFVVTEEAAKLGELVVDVVMTPRA